MPSFHFVLNGSQSSFFLMMKPFVVLFYHFKQGKVNLFNDFKVSHFMFLLSAMQIQFVHLTKKMDFL